VLDIKLIRERTAEVRDGLGRRGGEAVKLLEQVVELDRRWREEVAAAEQLRARQKALSGEVGRAKREGRDSAPLLAELQGLAAEVKERTAAADRVREELEEALLRLPNLPDPQAPSGGDRVERVVGEPPSFDFPPRDHLELAGERIDIERAARLSGSRFAYLRGELVLLELALVRFAFERLVEKGFEPVIPPVLVRERALYGTGFLPDTEQQIYGPLEDGLYLTGTSEVALASLHDSEILPEEALPRRYAGFSTCFRREAGAAGRDTRGIFRVHQFDKVEMFSFCHPDRSQEEHDFLLSIEEELLGELELPYRVVNIAVEELGASAAKKYDCEVYLPSQGRYRELTSCSNTTDFQARRLQIRMRPRGGKGTVTVHTLNGTAVAVGRTIIALLECHQRADGSVAIPPCLHPYGAPALIAPVP
jgi:seryl-tRNA synthetase